mgnify:CR=1 FL=1
MPNPNQHPRPRPATALAVLSLSGLWLAAATIASGTNLPAWAPLAAGAVTAVTVGIWWALTQLSHGGTWGWTSLHRPRPPRTDR